MQLHVIFTALVAVACCTTALAAPSGRLTRRDSEGQRMYAHDDEVVVRDVGERAALDARSDLLSYVGSPISLPIIRHI